MSWPAWLRAPLFVVVVATLASAVLTQSRLRVTSDISALFPSNGPAGALSAWTRAFGGRDPALVLVSGDYPTEVAEAAAEMADALRHAPSVARVVERVPTTVGATDPTLAWLFAGPAAQQRLAAAVTPEGMRERLLETRALLLSPGADSEALNLLSRDPLRLAMVPWEGLEPQLLAGAGAAPGGEFVGDGGRARLVIAEPRGSAFDSAAARGLVSDVERAERQVTAEHPDQRVSFELAGGHAIADATERMLRRDLQVSSIVSCLLASLAFVLTFRRVRALAAVLPPLVLGTLWTTGLAALLPSGLDAIAIAFAAVVVGVGVDTGVHVYSALLDARREGLSPKEAARQARRRTARPTLTAAVVAALTFGTLALGQLRAMRELGLLCGAGELLTAVAILLVTPEIGAWLERLPPPPVARGRFMEKVTWLTGTRRRAALSLAVCTAPIALLAVSGWPPPASALVAIRPEGIAPLLAEEHVRQIFGGRAGQWVVLTTDADAERARERADHVALALEQIAEEGAIDGFDALATFAPSLATRKTRLAARQAVNLPGRRDELLRSLRDVGFDAAACAPALEAFGRPTPFPLEGEPVEGSEQAWLFERHLAREGGMTLVATYVRPKGDPDADARARGAIAAADPASVVTGFGAIDQALREALSHDLVVIGTVAFAVVLVAMRWALRGLARALIALATLACEMGAVGLLMRLSGVKWHVYDALVVPVLFGVTIDESMFLLHSVQGRTLAEAMAKQGPLVSATALTTAAGFAALIACRYEGLRDLGAVGAIGVLSGLVAALVVVPALLRLNRGG